MPPRVRPVLIELEPSLLRTLTPTVLPTGEETHFTDFYLFDPPPNINLDVLSIVSAFPCGGFLILLLALSLNGPPSGLLSVSIETCFFFS